MRLLAAVLYVRRELAPFGLYIGLSRLTESRIDSIAMGSSVITVSGIYTSTSSGISSLAGASISHFAGCGRSALELYVRRELTSFESIFASVLSHFLTACIPSRMLANIHEAASAYKKGNGLL